MRLLLFLDELCASIVRSHRETSQYRVEELQALRWKLFSREEIQAYQSKVCALFSLHFYFLFFNFAISPSCVWAYSDSLKTKHVISHALRLRLVLFDESNRKLRKRLSSLPPPLLSLIFFFSWSERKQQGKLSDKIQKLEQQTELLGHWGWVFVRRVKCFAL